MQHDETPEETGEPVTETADQREVHAARAAQAEELDSLGGTPTTPTLPSPMARGLAKGAAIGAVVGAVLLTPLAFLPMLDMALIGRLIIVWIAGAAAGAAAGAVFLAGATAENENPENAEYRYADGTEGRQQGPGVH